MIKDLDFDKGRKEEKEKKFSDSMPRHFPEEMAEAKRIIFIEAISAFM